MTRPKRKAVPISVRREVVIRQGGVCKCGCGEVVYVPRGFGTHYDHEPALRLRDINEAGSDYVPAQHSIAHLDAYADISHAKKKTSGTGATTAGSDIGRIKKERRRERAPKAKRKIKSHGFSKSLTRKMDGTVTQKSRYKK